MQEGSKKVISGRSVALLAPKSVIQDKTIQPSHPCETRKSTHGYLNLR